MSVTPIDSGTSVSALRRQRDKAWEGHKEARIERCKAEIADLTGHSDKTAKRKKAAESEDARATRAFTAASRRLKQAQEIRAAA